MQSLEISLTTLNQWQEDKTPFTLIDIREEEERQASHMGGEWIPLSELSSRVDELPGSPIVFYCRSGARSLRATKHLRDALQRENIYSLAGGMLGANV
ncbi:MAG: rhodanese-like domain-containing protein [Chlamydiae bacterium]|nr:rhodanese-like domain-containing protein [Chlamydiota bacterium]